MCRNPGTGGFETRPYVLGRNGVPEPGTGGFETRPYVLGRNGVPEPGTGGFETRPYILGRNGVPEPGTGGFETRPYGEAGMGKVLSTLFHLGGEDLDGAQEARVRQGRHVQDEVLHAGLLELGDAIPDQ